jgi:hypothetical protein
MKFHESAASSTVVEDLTTDCDIEGLNPAYCHSAPEAVFLVVCDPSMSEL